MLVFKNFLTKSFIIYFIIGAFAALIDFLGYGLLINFGVNFLIAHPISVWLASTVKFFFNKHLTFKNKSKKIFYQYILSLLVLTIYLAFTEIFLFIFVFFGIDKILAKMLVILLGVGINYLLDKKITFGKQ